MVFVSLLGRFSSAQKECYQQVADVFIREGCEALIVEHSEFSCMEFDYSQFCVGSEGLPNMALFCPEACGCRGTDRSSACPPDCNA